MSQFKAFGFALLLVCLLSCLLSACFFTVAFVGKDWFALICSIVMAYLAVECLSMFWRSRQFVKLSKAFDSEMEQAEQSVSLMTTIHHLEQMDAIVERMRELKDKV